MPSSSSSGATGARELTDSVCSIGKIHVIGNFLVDPFVPLLYLHRLFDIDNDSKRLVFDGDEIDDVFRNISARRDNRGDDLADEPHLFARKERR